MERYNPDSENESEKNEVKRAGVLYYFKGLPDEMDTVTFYKRFIKSDFDLILEKVDKNPYIEEG